IRRKNPQRRPGRSVATVRRRLPFSIYSTRVRQNRTKIRTQASEQASVFTFYTGPPFWEGLGGVFQPCRRHSDNFQKWPSFPRLKPWAIIDFPFGKLIWAKDTKKGRMKEAESYGWKTR